MLRCYWATGFVLCVAVAVFSSVNDESVGGSHGGYASLEAGQFVAGQLETDAIAHVWQNRLDGIYCIGDSAGSTIAEANKAGIPVFTVDIANLSNQGKVVSHIRSDTIVNTKDDRKMGLQNAYIMKLGRSKLIKLNRSPLYMFSDAPKTPYRFNGRYSPCHGPRSERVAHFLGRG